MPIVGDSGKEWRGKVPRVLYEDRDVIYRTIEIFMNQILIKL